MRKGGMVDILVFIRILRPPPLPISHAPHLLYTKKLKQLWINFPILSLPGFSLLLQVPCVFEGGGRGGRMVVTPHLPSTTSVPYDPPPHNVSPHPPTTWSLYGKIKTGLEVFFPFLFPRFFGSRPSRRSLMAPPCSLENYGVEMR